MTPEETKKLTGILETISTIDLTHKGNHVKYELSCMIAAHHKTYVPEVKQKPEIKEVKTK